MICFFSVFAIKSTIENFSSSSLFKGNKLQAKVINLFEPSRRSLGKRDFGLQMATVMKRESNTFIPFFTPSDSKSVPEVSTHKKNIVNILRDNEVQVLDNNCVPLIKLDEIEKALKVLEQQKVLNHGLTLWKKEGDIFFEIYWKKGLYLDQAIREINDHSKSTQSNIHTINFCTRKCADFASKIVKDSSLNVEYFGLIIPQM